MQALKNEQEECILVTDQPCLLQRSEARTDFYATLANYPGQHTC